MRRPAFNSHPSCSGPFSLQVPGSRLDDLQTNSHRANHLEQLCINPPSQNHRQSPAPSFCMASTMAVITSVPGISITVHVNGEVAQEYPPVDPTDECTPSPPPHICYIESKSNHSFLVRLTLSPERTTSETNAILFTVFIDGMFAGGQIVYRRSTRQLGSPMIVDIKDQIIRSDVAGHCIRRSFSFSPVSLGLYLTCLHNLPFRVFGY